LGQWESGTAQRFTQNGGGVGGPHSADRENLRALPVSHTPERLLL